MKYLNQITHPMTLLCAVVLTGIAGIATPCGAAKARPETVLTKDGEVFQADYASRLTTLRAEISKGLPTIGKAEQAELQSDRDAAKAAQQKADSERASAGEAKNIEAKVANWRRYWIGGAEKRIAQAQADLRSATTDEQREAARKQIAKSEANKSDGEKAIEQALKDLDKAKINQPKLSEASAAAEAALAQARAKESSAAEALLKEVEPFLSQDALDAKLIECEVLVEATPRELAAFAQRGPEQKALVDSLLTDGGLMREMLVAGGASHGRYGQAMEICAAIRKASPRAAEGVFHRLALATSLEHAVPIKQNNAKDRAGAPAVVDPVQRYLSYEKAYLNAELDPAFQSLSTWELRMVINCDAPDEILAWGRQMLRNYRPDEILDPDYGWRYSISVRTDVRYGSHDVKNDLPSLNSYQNIIKDGGVCGRRAFFGRFILRAFGIPVWGVAQHKHAALSHWTPKGWVVNLGAGFQYSWWDKDETPLSGSDFLLETQAREHARDYLKVLRAQWIGRILGEPAYDGRKGVDGGIWSSLGHYQTILLASQAVTIGPLGEQLAESNESPEKQPARQATVAKTEQQVLVSADGSIIIPAVAHDRETGRATAMKSSAGGMQVLGSGGWTTYYVFDAPKAGKYELTAQVATVQEGQQFRIAANQAKRAVEIPVPFTIGMWKQTPPVEVELVKGHNTLEFSIEQTSRNVAIKSFTLMPVK